MTNHRTQTRMADLPESSRRLVRRMQVMNFGRIEHLVIISGRPALDRSYRTICTVKLAVEDNGPRPEAGLGDFELCKEQAALLERLSALPDGTHVSIDVKHGAPFLIEIEQEHSAV